MSSRLIDPSKPFKVVYALAHHQFLGFLLSAHVVPVMKSGMLSYAHQRLCSENADQFASGLDEDDLRLIKLLDEIRPRRLVKRFNGDPRKLDEFFLKKYKNVTLAESVQGVVRRNIGKALPLLVGRAVFEMGNDDYPARTPLHVEAGKADVTFHFIPDDHRDDHTRYFPTIYLGGERLKFINAGAEMISLDPAWMLLGDRLFSFNGNLKGQKLKPFLEKPYITIGPEHRDNYFRKFVPKLIAQHRVKSSVFDVRSQTTEAPPDFALKIESLDEAVFSLKREVSYDDHRFPLEPEKSCQVLVQEQAGRYTFLRVRRNVEAERKVRQKLHAIRPNKTNLTPWEYLPREDGLVWLHQHADTLRELGVKILQPEDAQTLELARPEVELEPVESSDWFDLKAVVHVGEFRIPFIKFRRHILSGKREYRLPDGSICILPESWFSDFRHLLEVAESPNGDAEQLRLHKYQAPLLRFSSGMGLPKNTFAEVLNGRRDLPSIAPPAGLRANLRAYQQEGLNWLCFLRSHRVGGILADDMGLGKTLQTLALLQHVKENGGSGTSLVVAPTSLLHNWLSEGRKFVPNLNMTVHAGAQRTRDLNTLADYDVVLMSYGIVRQDLDQLVTFPFDYLVLDESQNIKNAASKTAKAIKKLVARHRLALTGTPVENTVMDLWSQMGFLNPSLLGNETFFKRFYADPIEKDKDPRRTAKLRRIIYPFILRRRKRQVEKELPPRIERLHHCGMTSAQEEVYEKTRNEYRNYLLDAISAGQLGKRKFNILAGLQRLRQIAIHPRLVEPTSFGLEDSGKYREVMRLLRQLISKKSKVLIFSQFVRMLKVMEESLTAEGIPYCYLDGSTRDRQAQVDQFQTDPSIPVFLISLKAGGVGLNLTAAEYVFILDPWWNPAVENQAVDRSHRIGQQKTVFFYKFITEDTIEEKILALQNRKAALADDLISLEDDTFKAMTTEELESLLA